jgi:pimeloyl-ACP methyl ester carboxylesterase
MTTLKLPDRSTAPFPPLHVETWGDGTPVVLVHGSLALGDSEWEAQRPLAEHGFGLRVFDRRGYGRNAGAIGEDFLVDADDIVELMGTGVHLVGHSYGGLGAMLAAARCPDKTLSLTVLEPAAGSIARHDPAWSGFVDEVRALFELRGSDEEWVSAFLTAVGSSPEMLGPELMADAVALTPLLRHGRPFYECEIPVAELAAATFPKLVVAGGHFDGFDAMCRDLARQIDGEFAVVEGAGHEIQFTGDAINERLLAHWRGTR